MFDSENEKILRVPDTVKVLSTQMLQEKLILKRLSFHKVSKKLSFLNFHFVQNFLKLKCIPKINIFPALMEFYTINLKPNYYAVREMYKVLPYQKLSKKFAKVHFIGAENSKK